MPHLHVKAFKKAEFPTVYNEVSFDFIAINYKHPDEKLIASSYEGKSFFLLVKENSNKTLIKSDKITRPSPNYLIKHALLSYAKVSEVEVIASNIDEATKNIHLQNSTALRDINFFASSFPKEREVHIEVGFGSGRHLIHQAQNSPDILFIGIEIHKASIEQVLKQVSIKNLDNVLVLDYDARLFLELVPSNIVGKIFVHFPVPWDKKPNRRVISASFIDEAERVLKPQGRLELRTDSENYYAYSYETFISRRQVALQINKNLDIAISSKYEDRWKRMQKNIYDITMTTHATSEPLAESYDFSLDPIKISQKALIALNATTTRFKEGFIHFERLYIIEDGRLLYRLAMGSFDRPEHLYLIIDEHTCKYFPDAPVASRTNYKIHSYLKEILHG
ncbi:MAG: tRNA (guanosine(46)-N7)-methyltransferase TrmB [Campylobacterota bacterium]|nr:tRNA (guanosine(46)-N7)-methyltransferase TrmB [Campylobacterota bacterium]